MRYFFAHFASFWLGARKLNNVQVTKMKWLHLFGRKIYANTIGGCYRFFGWGYVPPMQFQSLDDEDSICISSKKREKNVQNNLTCAQFAKSHSYHKYLWFHSTVEINLIRSIYHRTKTVILELYFFKNNFLSKGVSIFFRKLCPKCL